MFEHAIGHIDTSIHAIMRDRSYAQTRLRLWCRWLLNALSVEVIVCIEGLKVEAVGLGPVSSALPMTIHLIAYRRCLIGKVSIAHRMTIAVMFKRSAESLRLWCRIVESGVVHWVRGSERRLKVLLHQSS